MYAVAPNLTVFAHPIILFIDLLYLVVDGELLDAHLCSPRTMIPCLARLGTIIDKNSTTHSYTFCITVIGMVASS